MSSLPATSTLPFAPDPLWLETVSAAPAALGQDVMACIALSPDGAPTVDGQDPRFIPLGLPLLAPASGCELWKSRGAVAWDRDAGIGFAHDGDVLFGSLAVLEGGPQTVAADTFKCYARIIAFLERQNYPHLLRCWNFLHDINHGDADHERYKQFCVGRHQALAAAHNFERQLPAGTAIGLREPGLLIYFIAGKQPGRRIENPRQLPAFQYPRQYGPRSPSFSRATFKPSDGGGLLLVSGTASVVGHASRHPGETLPQLDETVENLRALLDHAAAQLDGCRWLLQGLRLYLRDRAELPAVRSRLEALLGPRTPVLYLEGDICRTDLKLEIEAVYAARAA
jgi:chorismate lyase/3-hydroxybenzoate synthase